MNQSATQALTTVRFGIFEVDVRAGELRRNGIKVKLQEQPFRVLVMLLERPGEVVTREEIQQKLWLSDTFVDFEHSINAAVKRLREALDDDADNPRFVETLPRRGYRFIYPVAPVSPPATVAAVYDRRLLEGKKLPAIIDRRYRRRWLVVPGVGLAVAVLALTAHWIFRPVPLPKVISYTRLTHGAHIRWGPMGTDGTRVYFSATDLVGRPTIGSVSTAGGEIVQISTPLPQPFLEDASPDGTELLVSDATEGGEKRFYIVPAEGGVARRVGSIEGFCGAWSADGREVVISSGQAIYAIAKDGSGSRKVLTSSKGPAWPRPSPDGRTIRFSPDSTSVWEARMDGSNLHAVLPDPANHVSGCCGAWTRDGKYFLFEGTQKGAQPEGDIWALHERQGLLARRGQNAVRLTSGPLSFTAPTPSKDGKRIFAIGFEDRSEVVRRDPKSAAFVPYLPQVPTATILDFTHDGEWIAYVNYPDSTLWKCRPDGSQRIQLTFPPIQVDFPRWSPDGKRIAFTDATFDRILLISADGGTPENPAPGFHDVNDTGWSPDGKSLVFGGTPPGSSSTALNILDLGTHQFSKVPGSEGIHFPRWSPTGQFLSGVVVGGLMVFDFRTQKWTKTATQDMEYPTWSSNGEYLYFTRQVKDDWSVYRLRVPGQKLERVASLVGLQPTQGVGPAAVWFGLTPDDSILILKDTSSQEIYALDWEAP